MKAKTIKTILSVVLICSIACGCSAPAAKQDMASKAGTVPETAESGAGTDDKQAQVENTEQVDEDDSLYEEPFLYSDECAYANPGAMEVFDEIKRLNKGKEIIVTDDGGYITFLNGITTDKLCTTEEDYDAVVKAVLPALSSRSDLKFEFFEHIEDDGGNKYVNYKEVLGDEQNDINTIKLFFNSKGEMLGLSSTILPFAESTGSEIDEKKAVEVVKEHLSKISPKETYTVASNGVKKKFMHQVDPYSGVEYLKEFYVVTTNNPGQGSGISEAPYLNHLVTLQGEFFDSVPAYVNSEVDEKRNYDILDKWFDNADVRSYKTTVVLGDGIERSIEVPVVYFDGKYYLEDPSRKMLCADYYDFKFNEEINVVSSANNADWKAEDIVAYYNYLLCYDFYKDIGWEGPDGVGGQTILLMDYVDADKNPVNNLCYLGKLENVHLFTATSQNSDYSMSLDVAGHEYTHAVTNYIVSGTMYKNATGAINEGICDIMGELVELSYYEKNGIEIPAEDMFVIGQSTGIPLRDLLIPFITEQASQVGGTYYVPSVSIPDDINDYGGVHIDSGITSSICTEMFFSNTVSIKALQDIWETVICLMTSGGGYKELAEILPMACQIEKHEDIIDDVRYIIDSKGLSLDDPFEIIDEDRVLVEFDLPPWIDWTRVRLVMRDDADFTMVGWPGQASKTIRMVVDSGNYQILLTEFDRHSNAIGSWEYTENGWNGSEFKGEYVAIPGDSIVYKLKAMNFSN